MEKSQKLLLASASPARLELLRRAGLVPDKVESADIDETPLKNESPRAMVLRLAKEKAAVMHKIYPDYFIIAADTTAARGMRIIGKAENEKEARKIIGLLSGVRHRVYTGVSIISPQGKQTSKVIETMVKFRRMSKEEIDKYLESDEWKGKAGCFALQGRASAYIESINGSFTSVIGLPVAQTFNMLKNIGYLI